MGLLIWLIFGALVGWIASMIMGTNANQGLLGDIILGILGALVGGYLMSFFGQTGVSGFNLYSTIVAVIGAIVLIGLVRLIRR